jgi:hypothetical protein
VAEKPVSNPPGARGSVVFGHGPGRYVADSAAVEVAGGCVVNGVVVPPSRERRPDDQREHAADPEIRALCGQERPVRAVVKEDVCAQQEAARRNGDEQRKQVRHVEQPVHRDRESEVRQHARRQVQQTARHVRLRIGRKVWAAQGVAPFHRRRICPRPHQSSLLPINRPTVAIILETLDIVRSRPT